MGNILRIFWSDIKAICTHFFAVVIILAVLVIPALYAWVNIYANWNPYANTGNVPIAIASSDEGTFTDDGEYVNKGQEIVEEIAASTSIKWVVCASAEEAVAGVERGDYYGALVMQKNLSRNMYDLNGALRDKEPSIIFYQNAKTNAIANKISTTAATTAEYNIQVKYLTVLIEGILDETEETLKGAKLEDLLDHFIEVLTTLRDHMTRYVEMIQRLRDSESGALSGLAYAGQYVGGIDMSGAIGRTQAVEYSIAEIERMVLERAAEIDKKVVALGERIMDMSASDWLAMREELLQQLQSIEAELEALQSDLPADGLIGAAVSGSVNVLLTRAQSLEQALRSWDGSGDNEAFKKNVLTALFEMHSILNNNLQEAITLFFDSMVRDMGLMVTILSSVSNTVADIQPVFSAAQSVVSTAENSLAQFQTALQSATDSISQLLEKAIRARENDTLEELIELLHGDPKQFAEFFAQPVSVATQTIYPVENYGTAMTPFYSTLAIWVGCVVSGAIIKPEADAKGLRKARPHQLFWGRFLIFFLIGQIQAAIIVAGDIWLLGCQCLHPRLFFLCAAVTSLVFNILIYSLTVTFGDIGKAMGVVIMIVQIAGSSGSYPIEILPEIFSKIYTFFPFPYAINAMRETLCGLYRLDLFKYLGELCIFGAFGILIGLNLRAHFHGVNEFVEEEMEETGVL